MKSSSESWEERYHSIKMSSQVAAQLINSGDKVAFPSFHCEPRSILEAIFQRKNELRNVCLMQWQTFSTAKFLEPGLQDSFIYLTYMVSSVSRSAVASGRALYAPCHYREFPEALRRGDITIDVALISVSPPDDHGFFSFGLSASYQRAIAEAAKKVIAEVNVQMPTTQGDNCIHISEIDALVETDYSIMNTPKVKLTEAEKRIGEFVAELIEDGSTVQLGIGTLPDYIAERLSDKKDLGIHSEMISDGFIFLYESGAINNRRKTIHNGISITSFAMGSQKLYDLVRSNRWIQFYPVDYVANPGVIAKNYRMVAINAALQSDLTGQINAESIGPKAISGTGGQADFARGASLCPGGKSIIILKSTALSGTQSSIVSSFDPGTVVTTPRTDVHYVVTEYGIASLRFKTIQQRVEAMIRIAHPDFRDYLRNQAKKMYG